MSRWARTSSQHQKHRQGSTGVLVAERSELSEDSEFASFLEDVLNFCDAENLQMEAENTDDLIEELEVWARVPALDEDTRDQLRGFIEMAKKMVFKMLDKNKKTLACIKTDDLGEHSAHVDNDAKRVMVKHLLKDMLLEWHRRSLGLSEAAD